MGGIRPDALRTILPAFWSKVDFIPGTTVLTNPCFSKWDRRLRMVALPLPVLEHKRRTPISSVPILARAASVDQRSTLFRSVAIRSTPDALSSFRWSLCRRFSYTNSCLLMSDSMVQ